MTEIIKCMDEGNAMLDKLKEKISDCNEKEIDELLSFMTLYKQKLQKEKEERYVAQFRKAYYELRKNCPTFSIWGVVEDSDSCMINVDIIENLDAYFEKNL